MSTSSISPRASYYTEQVESKNELAKNKSSVRTVARGMFENALSQAGKDLASPQDSKVNNSAESIFPKHQALNIIKIKLKLTRQIAEMSRALATKCEFTKNRLKKETEDLENQLVIGRDLLIRVENQLNEVNSSKDPLIQKYLDPLNAMKADVLESIAKNEKNKSDFDQQLAECEDQIAQIHENAKRTYL